MDMVPRTTLAQSMDVLSSMASLAGYKAVIKAAEHYGSMFPMMTTAAGTIPPTRVMILGAGVAGLQAIATARRLGAVVEAFDTRAAAKEEVMSLGATFVEVEGAVDDRGAGGYAVQQSEEYLQKQRALVQEKALKSNIIIATAQVRGRKAPLLITEETINAMKPGSVIVDLAASTGGNCAYTENKKTIRIKLYPDGLFYIALYFNFFNAFNAHKCKFLFTHYNFNPAIFGFAFGGFVGGNGFGATMCSNIYAAFGKV
ncbi:MAG: hypothetical protein OT643_10355, partial [Bacteroidetes bacterium]|nr:hypothetical protein [Bacteroidota bacterium]